MTTTSLRPIRRVLKIASGSGEDSVPWQQMTDTLAVVVRSMHEQLGASLFWALFWQRYPVPMHGGEKRWAFRAAGPWFVSWKQWDSGTENVGSL